MRKLYLFLLLFCSIGAMADKVIAPDWMDAQQRELLYPASKYYTGFATTTIQKGEEKTAVYDRVKQNARVDAISSIQVSVEQTIERYIKNTQSGSYVSTTDIMTSRAKSHSGIKDVPGLNVEVWENPKTGDVSAFAYVKILDLSRRLMRRILTNVGKVETELQAVEDLVARGEKAQAKDRLPAVQSIFDDIENDQRVLLSVDSNVTDEDLAIEEVNALKKKHQTLVGELKNGIAIYLDCKADLFGKNYASLLKEIKGALSPIGCMFVDSPEASDWAIYIVAPAREYHADQFGSITTYTSYVDASISIDKTVAGKRVYEDEISVKGSHTHNYEQAARQAYKDISPKISKIIKEQIQQ